MGVHLAALSLTYYFTGLQVYASTLDDFVAVLEQHKEQLPVITQDLTDTWLMGVPSDPVKTAKMRVMQRCVADCLQAGTCSYDDPKFYNFSSLSIKNSEHTWGLHVSSYGQYQDNNYSNADFHALVHGNQKDLDRLASSWVEQRNYGINWALDAVANTPFAATLQAELAKLTPMVPDVSQDTPLPSLAVSKFGGWLDLAVDAATGGLIKLNDTRTGKAYADNNHQLGLLRYQTLTDADFEQQLRNIYLRAGTGGENEYGKPGCDSTQGCVSSLNNAVVQGVYLSQDKARLVVQVRSLSLPIAVFELACLAWKSHF